MEELFYISGNSIDYHNFVNCSKISPADKSFCISVGVGIFEALARVKNSKFSQPLWTNFKENILDLRNIDNYSIYTNSISILVSLCNIIEPLPIEEALYCIDYYAVHNESSLLEHMANCMKGIIYNSFEMKSPTSLTQDDIDNLSQKLKIYIELHSNQNIIISSTSEALPAVYLLEYEYENNVYYGNLIPKEFLNIKNEMIVDENSIPFVNINLRLEGKNNAETNYKGPECKKLLEDVEVAEVKSLSSAGDCQDGKKIDNESDLRSEHAKELIKYMLEVLGNRILPEECARKILKAAEEDGYKDENIDKISAQIEEKDMGIRYFNISSSKIKCNKCAMVIKETFPIRLICKTTSLCVDCIVNNYKNTYSFKCADCPRVYTEQELSFINSFIFENNS